MHGFGHVFQPENQLLTRLAIAQVIGISLTVILLRLLPPELHWISLVLAILGMLAALSVTGFLLARDNS
jgi:putative flippase GtrA